MLNAKQVLANVHNECVINYARLLRSSVTAAKQNYNLDLTTVN